MKLDDSTDTHTESPMYCPEDNNKLQRDCLWEGLRILSKRVEDLENKYQKLLDSQPAEPAIAMKKSGNAMPPREEYNITRSISLGVSFPLLIVSGMVCANLWKYMSA